MPLNLESAFNRDELNLLFSQVEGANNSTERNQLLRVLKDYMESQFTIYEDLKYAIDQSTTITMTDRAGRITYVDQNFCELTGYTKQDLLKRSHRIINSDYHEKSFFKEMWDTILSGNVWNGEIRNKTKDGAYFWVSTTIVPLVGDEGQPHSFVAFRTDISHRKNLEEQLVDALDHDYRRIFNSLVNLVFRVEKKEETATYQYKLITGKLAHKLGIDNTDVELKKGSIFGQEDTILPNKIEQVYKGKEITFKNQYNGYHLYTMLSPIIENDKVVEVVGSSVDITSLKAAEQQVRHLENYDPLLNIPNRTKLNVDLMKRIQKKTETRPFTILYCDVDRLKYINDGLGQSAGDQVLRIIAERIKTVIDPCDQVYRFGGDEYIIVIDHYDSYSEIGKKSDLILQEIKQPLMLDDTELSVTASIGISEYKKDGSTKDELINHASIAMHYCKLKGRDNRLFYQPDMETDYNELVFLEGEIRQALENNEFMLYFQPKVNVATGELIGMEALIRWNHVEKGFISPGKFIPLAEETGLVVAINEWVINKACMQHNKWIDQGYEPVPIAVNVSAIDLQRQEFAKIVKDILETTNMDPQFLELEITENSVMENTEACIATMNQLKAIGVSISIDDFGTGYSSFGYLPTFPINYLKIDQSFIKGMLANNKNAEIVKAMIGLAHTFDLKVIAEGVEEEEMLTLLREYKCDYYQGFYYSKPMSSKDIQEMLPMIQH